MRNILMLIFVLFYLAGVFSSYSSHIHKSSSTYCGNFIGQGPAQNDTQDQKSEETILGDLKSMIPAENTTSIKTVVKSEYHNGPEQHILLYPRLKTVHASFTNHNYKSIPAQPHFIPS